MYQKIWTRYCQLHAEAEFNETIRSHLADNLYEFAYWSARYNRWASFRAYLIARNIGLESGVHNFLLKYLTRWSLGASIWRTYNALKRLTKPSA